MTITVDEHGVYRKYDDGGTLQGETLGGVYSLRGGVTDSEKVQAIPHRQWLKQVQAAEEIARLCDELYENVEPDGLTDRVLQILQRVLNETVRPKAVLSGNPVAVTRSLLGSAKVKQSVCNHMGISEDTELDENMFRSAATFAEQRVHAKPSDPRGGQGNK
jgi:hypothetical protein